jgi:hypothetical protein
MRILSSLGFCTSYNVFGLQVFVGTLFYAHFQTFQIGIKFWFFWYPVLKFSRQIFSPVILVQYANFACTAHVQKMDHNKFLAKSKKLFYCKYLSISAWIPSRFENKGFHCTLCTTMLQNLHMTVICIPFLTLEEAKISYRVYIYVSCTNVHTYLSFTLRSFCCPWHFWFPLTLICVWYCILSSLLSTDFHNEH